jgi:hypothetical protein
MRYNDLSQLIHRLPTTQTVLLLGAPGIGKTSCGRSVAKLMTDARREKAADAPEALCVEIDLSSSLPEDITGLPGLTGDVTVYRPVSWVHELCQPDAYGVLILDDLPAATQAVQVACRQIALERRVHRHKFAPGVRVIVTGNRREDKSCATQLPAHFRNSCVMLQTEADLEDWSAWAAERAIPGVIASYLRFRNSNFSKLPKDQDDQGAFATPRTWTMLGECLPAAEASNAVLDVASGLVGSGVASDFVAFLRVHNELPDLKRLLEDPVGTLPNPPANQPDRTIALATGLGEIVAKLMREARGAKRETVALNFFRALGHVTRSNREYCGAAVSTFLANGGKMTDILPVVPKLKGDPLAGELLAHLQKALG